MQRRSFVSCRRPGIALSDIRTDGNATPPLLGARNGETSSALDDLLMIDAPLAPPSPRAYPRLVVDRDAEDDR